MNDTKKLETISYWSNILNIPKGWSYDLEITWILRKLESNGIKKGSTILDAGGGLGVMQYILSSLGYNVISVDYAPRTIPPRAKKIFNIHLETQANINYGHHYMDSLDYESGQYFKIKNRKNYFPVAIINKISKILLLFYKKDFFQILDIPLKYIQYLKNLSLWYLEVKRNHNIYGNIKFVRAAFHNLPINNNDIDAVVCLASLGHVDKKLINSSIGEFKRVLKPFSPMIITTCATDQSQDVYYEKTQGWCFCLSSLKKIASDSVSIDFDYSQAKDLIINSKILRSRLSRYYYLDPESIFYRKKYTDLPYLPVGLVL